jgi:Asp-tRNA(Asn)/Glu-tRNA(Gln) amidotransferase A subunit family amidase
MNKVFEKIDLYIGGDDLHIANLTGHPTVVMPHEFVKTGGVDVPGSITFTGNLFQEDKLLAVAHAFQLATGHHLRRPPLKV